MENFLDDNKDRKLDSTTTAASSSIEVSILFSKS